MCQAGSGLQHKLENQPKVPAPCLHMEGRVQELQVYLASHAINFLVLTRMKFKAKGTMGVFALILWLLQHTEVLYARGDGGSTWQD